MRLFAALLFVSTTLNVALAANPSPRDQRLAEILIENNVEPFGKRQSMRAYLYCSTSKSKFPVLKCSIAVDGPGPYAPYSVYETLKGEAAAELSDLILQFGIEPSGKRQVQRMEVLCKFKEKRAPETLYCTDVTIF